MAAVIAIAIITMPEMVRTASLFTGHRSAAGAMRIVQGRRRRLSRRNRARADRETAIRHKPPATRGSWTAALRRTSGSAGRAPVGRGFAALFRAHLRQSYRAGFLHRRPLSQATAQPLR